jgi:hypothetical protein
VRIISWGEREEKKGGLKREEWISELFISSAINRYR